jgi:hypothetical protein
MQQVLGIGSCFTAAASSFALALSCLLSRRQPTPPIIIVRDIMVWLTLAGYGWTIVLLAAWLTRN